MTKDASKKIDDVARAICAENCAFYGEPPCHNIGEWPNTNCDEPGCMALAKAAFMAAWPKVKPLVWKEIGSEWLRAVSLFGQYNVMWGIEPGIVHLDHAQKLTMHETLEAAKAAAQADYEARILGALE